MSAIYTCSISMSFNLAGDFGYPPHFLVVHILLGFFNEIIDLLINKYILGIFYKHFFYVFAENILDFKWLASFL